MRTTKVWAVVFSHKKRDPEKVNVAADLAQEAVDGLRSEFGEGFELMSLTPFVLADGSQLRIHDPEIPTAQTPLNGSVETINA